MDFVALLVAFGGLFVFLVWRISDELEHLETSKAACKKVVEHERSGAKTWPYASHRPHLPLRVSFLGRSRKGRLATY
jgi:hypothetical protein